MYTGEQFEVDLEKKRCRRFSRFLFFFKLGEYWEKTPITFSEVSVSKVNLLATSFLGFMTFKGDYSNDKTKCFTYRVYLRSKVKNILVYDGDLKKARIEAEKVAKYLDLKVVDHTLAN